MMKVRNVSAIFHCNEVFIMKPNYEPLNARDVNHQTTDWSTSHI